MRYRFFFIFAFALTVAAMAQNITLTPTRGTTVANVRPPVGATLMAPAANFTLWVDGADVTSQAQRSGSSVLYYPPSSLQTGRHVARFLGTDTAGNAYDETWEFSVGYDLSTTLPPGGGYDTGTYVPPSGSFALIPGRDSQVSQPRPMIGASVPSPGGRFTLWVDGADVSNVARWSGNSLIYQPTQDLSSGRHVARILGQDAAGNAYDETWYFNVVGSGGSTTNPTLALFPNRGQTINNRNPDIGATVPVAGGRFTLWVDNVDVSNQARWSGNSLYYRPYQPMQSGKHVIRLLGQDGGGNAFDEIWEFYVR